jgi:hypothetical protein
MPKILVTTYKGNQSIDTWMISYVWSLIFALAQEFKVFDSRYFRLFGVTMPQSGQ